MKSTWAAVLLLALPAAASSASSRPVVRSIRARSYQGGAFSNGRMTNVAPAAPVFRSASHSTFSHTTFSQQAFFSPSRVSYLQQTAASQRMAPMRRGFIGGKRRFGDSNPGGNAPPPPGTTPPPPGPSPTTQDQTPPPWAVTGALIRTQGLGFLAEPAAPSGIHSTDAGSGIIALEEGRAQYLGSRGLFVGPKDTPPSSGSGGASGRSAITPNAPASGGN